IGVGNRWCLSLRWPFGDVDHNNRVDASDIQLVINSALGIGDCDTCDLDQNGATNAVDVQMVINAALRID
ncbi:MAG: hypothetical protein J7M12_02075, partial [Candidatus Hydrogenedentes bacterium]|nr:hypothetical protein [Candidatus Hydrogenedentota bacterium]